MGKTQTPERERITKKKSQIKQQLKTGLTRCSKRPLTQHQKETLQREFDLLDAEVPQGRVLGPSNAQTNAHVTSETNRVIETIESMRNDISNRVSDVMTQEIGNAVAAICPPPPPVEDKKELYIMTNPRILGEYKVGRSNRVDLRRAGMCASQNFDMELLAVFFDLGRLESLVHAALESKRVQEGPGQEWFKGTFEEIVSAIILTARQNGHDVQNYFSRVTVPDTATTV